MKHTYYYLYRKTDRYIFYVGRCITGRENKRLKEHIYNASKATTPKDVFIQQNSLDIGIMPFEIVVDNTNNRSGNVSYREKYWIQTLLRLGYPLLNNTLHWMSQYDYKPRQF